MASSSKQTGLLPQLFETSERKGPKEDVKIEMCRNLSWHRAFFTNDGLLDAEELASMTEGDGRDVKHQLQGIEEKLCRSMDSISTLGSDTSLEAKLFEEMEASKQKSSGSSKLTNSSNKGSSGEGDSKAKPSRFSPKGTKAATTQASKVTGPRRSMPISLSPLGSSAPVKTERSSPLGGSTSGTSPVDNVKSSARRSTSSKTGKATTDSTSKTPPGIRAKNKISNLLSSNLSSKTSPTSSASSSSTSDANQRSSKSSGAPRKSLVNSEKSSATNARRKEEQRIGKTPSSIGFKNKPPPLNSHPSSPLGLSNSSPSKSPASSISQRPSESSSILSRGSRGTSAQQRSLNRDASAKSTLKDDPTPERTGKQPAALRPQTGSISGPPVQSMGRRIPSTKSGFIDKGRSYKSCLLTGLPENAGTQSKTGSANGAKATKVSPLRTVAAALTGLKPNSQKTTTTTTTTTTTITPPPKPSSQKQQSSGKAKPSSSIASRPAKTLVLTSPEVLDIKGKLNALRMEISNQKKDESKDIKMAPAGSGQGKPSSNIYISSSYQAKSTSMKENDQIPRKVTAKDSPNIAMK